MKIRLHNAGKRFNRDWIFRHLDITLDAAGSYAITGPNGSGKSTLLQVIAGATLHSEGQVLYTAAATGNEVKEPYKHIAIAAPYLELIEELTASELLRFHSGFKTLTASIPQILSAVNLEQAAHKQVRYFSSGMKQRLKLAQAFFSVSSVLLLDEPTTNLDVEGTTLYQQLVQQHVGNRLLVVSSNVPAEYSFCKQVINIATYK